MGNREIALYLINKGARFTLFVAAMVGKIEIVKSMIEPYPELIKSKGPHGLDLIHHATKGGENAVEVLNYLKSNPDKFYSVDFTSLKAAFEGFKCYPRQRSSSSCFQNTVQTHSKMNIKL